MLHPTTRILAGIALILIVGGLVYSDTQNKRENPTPTQTSSATETGITLAEVAEHNSRTSCWSVIAGNVYDLTSWIPNHPGGEQRILNICGKDGTEAFTGKHGQDERPTMILASFKLDTLAQ